MLAKSGRKEAMKSGRADHGAFARSLLDRASRLSDDGKFAEAIPVLREAEGAYRELVRTNDREALQGLALTLTAYATALLNTGAAAAASPVINEAVAAHRRLLRAHRSASVVHLAESLLVQGKIAAKNMMPTQAVKPLMEVLQFASTNPGKVQSQGLAALTLLAEIHDQDPDQADREWKRVVDGGLL
jgi:tetratricopeptide (TPR) repeat protein